MVKFLTKALVWFVVHAIAFFVLVWVLLGMGPQETYQQIVNRVISFQNGTASFSQSLAKTGASMGRVGQHHLNEMDDRTNGIDPYQRHNSTIDANTRRDFGAQY